MAGETVTLALLDGVETRLREGLPDLDVAFYPDTPEHYRLGHQTVGAVLVGYGGAFLSAAGGTYRPVEDSEIIVQRRTVIVALVIQVRSLRERHGAIAVMDQIRSLLLGFAPPHGGPLYGDREFFMSSENGIWSYGAHYRTDTVAVADADGDTGPLLKHLTLTSPYGDRDWISQE